MPKLRRLSGTDLIKIFANFGFEKYSQKGSHIKLRRVTVTTKETLTIPNHKQLDTGTCYAIYKQASKYIPKSELEPYFYE